jgi:hypothetical protein
MTATGLPVYSVLLIPLCTMEEELETMPSMEGAVQTSIIVPARRFGDNFAYIVDHTAEQPPQYSRTWFQTT